MSYMAQALLGGVGMSPSEIVHRDIKVTVIGAAGGVGQIVSMMLKIHLPAGSVLALYDIEPYVKGVGVDISHIDTDVKVEEYEGDEGYNSELAAACSGASLVVITAGVPRKPGMSREDLLTVNGKMLAELLRGVEEGSFLCICTNPVNSLIPLAAEVLKARGIYDRRKLFGVTVLDSMRSCAFANEMLPASVRVKEVVVVGGHSAKTIVPLFSRTEAAKHLTDLQLAKVIHRIRNAGTEVVAAKAGYGSATFCMGTATAFFVVALVDAIRGVREPIVCAMVDMEAVDPPYFCAWPVRVGTEGMVERIELGEVSPREQEMLDDMLPELLREQANGMAFLRDYGKSQSHA